MSFPADYTNYQEITIDSTKVSADLTDFVIYIDLADLVKAGNDIFDSCRTDGGDIRVTKSDGTTELAREVVAIDTTAKTGELHIKFSGTLSSSSDTVIRIWYNGTDTEPASTATYGSEAVWSNYMAVSHFEEASGTISDSTGNSNTGSVTGATYGATGKLAGKAMSLDGSGDYISYTSLADADLQSGDFTMQIWAYKDNTNDQQRIVDYSNTVAEIAYKERSTSGYEGVIYDGAYNIINPADATTGAWRKLTLTYDDSATTMEFIIDGSSQGTDTSTENPAQTGFIRLGSSADSVSELFEGDLDEFRFSKQVLSENWETTEYNNQNSASTFYSVGDEVGGGLTADLTEGVSLTESVQKATTRAFSESNTLTDSFSSLAVKLQVLAESLTLSENLATRITGRVLAETITAADTVVKTLLLALSEAASLADSIANQVYVSLELTEAVSVVESMLYKLNGVNALWSDLYTDTADAWSDIYNDN